MARASVSVGRSPSGTLATMMPSMNTTFTQSGRSMTRPQAKNTRSIPSATTLKMRTMRATSRSSGVGGLRTSTLSDAIFPNSVRRPVA